MIRKIIKKIKNSYIVGNYRKILHYVKPYKFRALAAILATIPIGIIDPAIPWALKEYFDSIAAKPTSNIYIYMPLLIVLFSIVQSTFTYIATYLNSWVGIQISNALKYDLFKKLVRQDMSFFDKNSSGVIQMRFNTDVDTACAGLLNHLKMFLTRIFNSISLIIALFVLSWRLAIVAAIILLIALYPLTTITKRIRSIVGKTVYSGAIIATHYIEAFSGNRTIASYNLYDHLAKKISNALDFAFKLGIKMVQRTGILSPIMHLIIGTGIAVIIFIGTSLINDNLLTTGEFVAFLTSVIMLYQPIKSMGNELNEVNISIFAMQRIFSILEENPAIINKPNAIPLSSVTNEIEYRNVNFEYECGKPVLQNINLKIKVGKTIALVGNSGGGKTTFVNLLPRLYDINSGEILIGGVDIRDMEIDSLRDKISVVFQDNFLFSGTIRDNIAIGKNNATKSEIDHAVKSAYLEKFVSELSEGIDTKIGERGILLSGGQKQRIAIARAFLKNAPILILDEATSSLDNKSEAIVQKAINNLMKKRTVIIIAHKLSTIKNADEIVVINNGNIVETGTHNKLLMQNSAYSSLYNTQVCKLS